jgi:hypothetical protein
MFTSKEGAPEMATEVLTVVDVLRKIRSLKKDIEYVRELEEKWRDQKSAFPLIYEGIRKQIESLREQIFQLKTLKVQTAVEEVEKAKPTSELKESAVSREALNIQENPRSLSENSTS